MYRSGADLIVVRRADVERVLTRAMALGAARAAFSAAAKISPMPFEMILPEGRGEVHAKGGYQGGSASFALKIATWFAGADASMDPRTNGLTLVFDADDGALTHLVADGGMLTDWRTAAAVSLATDLMARRDARRVLIVGTGAQAQQNAEALLATEGRGDLEVHVWGRRPDRAARFAERLHRSTGARVVIDDNLEEAVRRAEIVITSTAAKRPVVQQHWIQPGTHLTAMGSDTPEKRELGPGVVAAMDRIVVDSRDLSATVGETYWAVTDNEISSEIVTELAAVVSGRATGRGSADERTLADLAGIGIQDATIAHAVTTATDAAGLGERVVLA
jgi:ornithine cyclodeaminase